MVVSINRGSPKSSILNGIFSINHPAIGVAPLKPPNEDCREAEEPEETHAGRDPTRGVTPLEESRVEYWMVNSWRLEIGD